MTHNLKKKSQQGTLASVGSLQLLVLGTQPLCLLEPWPLTHRLPAWTQKGTGLWLLHFITPEPPGCRPQPEKPGGVLQVAHSIGGGEGTWEVRSRGGELSGLPGACLSGSPGLRSLAKPSGEGHQRSCPAVAPTTPPPLQPKH